MCNLCVLDVALNGVGIAGLLLFETAGNGAESLARGALCLQNQTLERNSSLHRQTNFACWCHKKKTQQPTNKPV